MGITPKERMQYLRRRKSQAAALIASSFTFGVVSLLWLFSLDYHTMGFKIVGALTLLVGITFLAGVWIYSGAVLDLEQHLQRTRRVTRRR